MFKRQQNESPYGKSVTVTERVLCFYCYWLCWVDIAVGLLVWCLKDNRMNRLTVKVCQLLRGFVFLLLLVVLGWYSGWFVGLMFKRWQSVRCFSQNGRLLDRFRKTCHSELHENSTVGLIVNVKWQTDWRPAVACKKHILDFERKLTILLLHNSE
jgi:hypothetical protein